MRRLLFAVAFLGCILGPGASARAQAAARIDLYPLDISRFPTVSALFDVFDTNGIFASGLQADAVTVTEDGRLIPPASLGEMAVPLQIVVSVNQGAGLDARDPTGLSRFERAMQVLSGWVQTLPTDLPDDFSLVSQAGPVMNHGGPADFQASLRTFRPDLRAAVPNLQSLSIAIDIAAAQTPRPGMKRAVLFITPHMDDANIGQAVLPYIERAVQNNVRVFVWFLDWDLHQFSPSATAFNALAFGTGGGLFGYSGETPFPDPETYFSPLRRVYSLAYISPSSTGGDHAFSVEVKLASGVVKSVEQKFSLVIQRPNPILVNPPLQITRQAPADDPFGQAVLLPIEQPIEILVEFPDQHPRPLVRTTLYVDGAIADENAAEPFEFFTWELSDYSASGEHQLVVEAVDSIGLSNTSISIPVTLTVIQPPRGISGLLARYRQPITVGAVGLAGLALVAILLTGRLRVPSLRAAMHARRVDQDPLTQPVASILTPPVSITKDKPRKRAAGKAGETLPPAPVPMPAPAELVRLAPDGRPAPDGVISLALREMTIGADPAQCNVVLADASVSAIHARLQRSGNGDFLLKDAGSVAGTWVNLEPIPPEGHKLVQGDMVHFGRLFYRFALKEASYEAIPPVIEAQNHQR